MKKIFVFTAVFLSLALSTAPAFARTSLIGTHGRHGRTTTTVSNTQTAATATQTTTSTVTPATVNTTLPSTATAVGTTVLAREVAASVLVNESPSQDLSCTIKICIMYRWNSLRD